MKQRPLTELTSALRDNVFHILHLNLDSRTGQGGRGGGGLEKLPHSPALGACLLFASHGVGTNCSALTGANLHRWPSWFLRVSLGGHPVLSGKSGRLGLQSPPGPLHLCVSSGLWPVLGAVGFSLCGGLCVGSPALPPSVAAGLRTSVPMDGARWRLWLFYDFCSFSGRSLWIWGQVNLQGSGSGAAPSAGLSAAPRPGGARGSLGKPAPTRHGLGPPTSPAGTAQCRLGHHLCVFVCPVDLTLVSPLGGFQGFSEVSSSGVINPQVHSSTQPMSLSRVLPRGPAQTILLTTK